MWGQRVHGKSLYLNFAVNLNYSKKIKPLKDIQDHMSVRDDRASCPNPGPPGLKSVSGFGGLRALLL